MRVRDPRARQRDVGALGPDPAVHEHRAWAGHKTRRRHELQTSPGRFTTKECPIVTGLVIGAHAA